jgi:hypothetical protein
MIATIQFVRSTIIFFCFIFTFEKKMQDREIRKRLQDSEFKLGSSMPLDAAKERSTQLEAEVTSLERYFQIIAMWSVFAKLSRECFFA